MDIQTHNNVNFNARCPEIRMGQYICHVIKSEFPTCKTAPLILKIDSLHQKNKMSDSKYKEMLEWANRRIQYRTKGLSETLWHTDFRCYLEHLDFMQQYKIADCGQLAALSAFILKLNGYNAVLSRFKLNKDTPIDNAVCLFNRNNKPLTDITKDTIIIDPYNNVCDFALKALATTYKNLPFNFQRHCYYGLKEPIIEFKQNDKLSVDEKYINIDINFLIKKLLRKKYPQFIIKTPITQQQSLFSRILKKLENFGKQHC